MLAGKILNSTPEPIYKVPQGLSPRIAMNICNTDSNPVDVVIEVSRDGNNWYTLMNTTIPARTTVQLTDILVTLDTQFRGQASVAGVVHVVVMGA